MISGLHFERRQLFSTVFLFFSQLFNITLRPRLMTFFFSSDCMLAQKLISGAVALFFMLSSVGLFLLMMSTFQPCLKKSGEASSTFPNTSTVQ